MSCKDSIDPKTLLERLDKLEKTVAETEEVESENNEEDKLTEEEKTEVTEKTEETTVEEPVVKSDEPKREDYDCPFEFHKAYAAWITKKEAEAPITKADIAKMFTDFKKDILEAVPTLKLEGDVTIGEAVKKSIPVKQEPVKAVDYNAWLKTVRQVDASRVPVGGVQ